MLPSEAEFWNVATPREARARLSDALRFELLGPSIPDEVLRESPISRYAAGMLAPFGTEMPDEERDEELTSRGEDEEAGAVDVAAPMSQAITPSSIGLSFLVSKEIDRLLVRVTWGDYHSEDAVEDSSAEGNEQTAPKSVPEDGPKSSRKRGGRRRRRWVRTPQAPEPVTIRLALNEEIQREALPNSRGVSVEHLTRTLGERVAVSVFLVNRRKRGERARPPVDRWVFQPTISVQAQSNEPVFLPRELEPASVHSDRDRATNRLLFRNRREFAVGHGCAAEWRESSALNRADQVRTELMPTHEVPKVDSAGQSVSMKTLAGLRTADELRQALAPVVEEYGAWIKNQEGVIEDLSSDLQPVAKSNLGDCAAALSRMQNGLRLLVSDKEAFRAFRFANRAMLLQRSHTVWSRQRRRDPKSAPASAQLEGYWHPFQLAFILLNVSGIVDVASDDRRIGDLLWFPTGGGKTEAYLGLAAFTMALRRRRTNAGMRTDAGLAVLMRYTLRLVTIQQFQRATTLLCACEVLRSAQPRTWGDYRFSIGLWLGYQGTPNSHDESRRSLARIQQDPSETGPNPCQLEACPWCGEPLTPDDYWVDGEAIRTRVACPREECDFSKVSNGIGLPILVVDEEIYHECPSMLIATVDKFAQMPWNGQVQALFGFVDRECDRCGFLTPATPHVDRHRPSATAGAPAAVRETERLTPPDLIIQDELHLISGPLGTLVGLYETAVDFLCARRVNGRLIGPKVVASTATARRAFEQIQAVFQRSLRVFPPPGVAPNNSFFAVERDISDNAPGRVFLGVCAPGKSMKTAYIRVAAALLSAVAGLGAAPSLAEPYETLLSYFNSLRELGGAIRLLDDDIPARLLQLRTAGLPAHQRPIYVELTSRIRQEEIPRLLRRLELRHDSVRAEGDALPLDVLLASNMISVGVDIDRLGLMTVTGQPKTSAEYIQATSRVGRQAWGPGLVVTIYNWSRPRDMSHYERFRHYHATLYRSVEAVSATPFSSRALDRGLRGTYVAATRLGSDSWSPEPGAALFDPDDPRVREVVGVFRRRAEAIAGQKAADQLTEALKGLADEWWGYKSRPLRYGWRSPDPRIVPAEDVLLRTQEGGRVGHWPAPQSLREVEEQSLIRVFGVDAN